MDKTLIFLDPNSELSLQAQIRQKLVEAVTSGIFPLGQRLPSSRKLAEQLGVARNTVVLVYEQLIDEGYLISREGSGIYVNSPEYFCGWADSEPVGRGDTRPFTG
jgi:GntR family transcriptional regulator/MocR family aminotransferase